jgi:hypothetical protein
MSVHYKIFRGPEFFHSWPAAGSVSHSYSSQAPWTVTTRDTETLSLEQAAALLIVQGCAVLWRIIIVQGCAAIWRLCGDIFAGIHSMRAQNAVRYPQCHPMNPTLMVQGSAKERGLPGIVLHPRPNATILGTSMSFARLPVETVQILPTA